MPVEVVDYDPAWPGRFAALRQLVVDTLGDAAVATEHVGSTSIPGLAAKPIIAMDLALAHYSSAHELRPSLHAAGFPHPMHCHFAAPRFPGRRADGRRSLPPPLDPITIDQPDHDRPVVTLPASGANERVRGAEIENLDFHPQRLWQWRLRWIRGNVARARKIWPTARRR